MLHISDKEKQILQLGQAMAKEKYFYKLFDLVLEGCMKFTAADAGIFYLSNHDVLKPAICKCESITNTVNLDKTEASAYKSNTDIIDLDKMGALGQDVSLHTRSILSYALGRRKIIKFDDVYNEKNFDISALREFDRIFNYRTKSIMVIPIIDVDDKIQGIIQLWNCMDDSEQIVPFSDEYDVLVEFLTSQMSARLSNIFLIQELEDLLESFVQAMTTAIDARTPYNANHTLNVAKLCDEFTDYINQQYYKGQYRVSFISRDHKDQLHMAAMLHDIGKLITKREILNKATRLGNLYDGLLNRLKKIRLYLKIDMLEGRMDQTEWTMEDLRLENFIADLPRMNVVDIMTERDLARISDLGRKIYISPKGEKLLYLNENERKALNIVKGTLTLEERKEVEKHVEYTEIMLDKIKFNEKYNLVRNIAVSHHEYLNGTGYPRGLRADKISVLTRVLTIADIYDSLTSNDRPYKGTVSVPRALQILDAMVEEGKLDRDIVEIFTVFVKERYSK